MAINDYNRIHENEEIVSTDESSVTVKDKDTGNLRVLRLIDLNENEVKDKELAEKIRNHFKRMSMRKTDWRGSYFMTKTESSLDLKDQLTLTDRRYLMILMIYAQFDKKPFEKNGKALSNKDIAKIWKIDEVNAYKKLAKFCELGIINQIKNKNDKRKANYVINDTYFVMGKLKSQEKFVKVYQSKLKEILDNIQKIEDNKNRKRNKPIDIKDVIGILHAVIPYFHFQTYYLVKNPDEKITIEGEAVLDALERTPKALKHLPKTQIGRILGHRNPDRPTIDKYFSILQQAGAVMVLTTNGRSRYLVHPDLMFRLDSNGQDEYTRHIRAQFGQHDN
ncbi:hypothetical protein [Bacillus sp. AFS040349]|uniref:hypothetical protein n=1 Tax=Bacillus sp. AFS040349 TaxID=2033502 RepID=UPI000BFC374B|nr:hypothetical protein [Bacillus sp. AFS040349]PGT79159.1 hypothetical protein COD11_23015 [Bacillus sp. AFS040349]